ncbi:MAG: tetratricopeptide repeat protein [Desulfobacteraceae bacterium]|jgi:hypothetical protein
MLKIYFIIIVLLISNTAFADSTASLIDRGNKSWIAGDYDAALKDYDEAAVDNPESPYIYFNKGAAFYKKGDYSAAIEEFEKAALKSKDPETESKSRFNLGNCAFREAERQMDSDLKKSLDFCQKSILHYQDALKLDPELTYAAENIEIVRLYMKNILDEIKKQEEEAKEREKQAKQNAEELQKLIKRQENALEKNRKISGSQINQDEKNKKLDQLADEQKKITDDTQKLVDKIKNQSAQQNQEKENPSLTHLNNAVKEQEAAEGNLRNSAASIAEKNQENAVKELKDALTPPEQDKNKQQGSQQNKDQQEQQGQEEQQKQEASQDPNQPQNEEQAEMQEASEDAQDILNEEKENQKQRRMIEPFGYRDVEKDW